MTISGGRCSLIIEYGFNLVKREWLFLNYEPSIFFYPIRKCRNRKSIEPKNDYVTELIAAMVIYYTFAPKAFSSEM
jgi:hypothetical protein